VFWKILEFLIRLIHFKRFRQADKIGAAAELAGRGRFHDALLELEALNPKLHPSLRSIHALTRGRILDASGKTDEAEQAFAEAALADPSNAKAHLDLAVIAGRRFHFEDARARLSSLAEDGDEQTKEQANEILCLLDQVTSGQREIEFKERASKMANRPIGPNREIAGLPADLAILDSWIYRDPDAARGAADEIALLLGQGEVFEKTGRWKVSLSLEESFIAYQDGTKMHPFKIVSERFSSRDTDLKTLMDRLLVS
jgi:tetratricopeptide (TPR) repeat protein